MSKQAVKPLELSSIATPARSAVVAGATENVVSDLDLASPADAPAISPAAAPAISPAAAPAIACNHIRVAVRVRPAPPGDDSIIEVAGEGAIAIRKEAGTGGNEFLRSQQGRTEERMFDRVFGSDATQEEVYLGCCQPIVRSAVSEGRSATVFVYGATGAGKTHTMFGEREDAQQGLICRAIREAFGAVADRAQLLTSGRTLEVKVSFLDIYNESVRDLLQDGGGLCKVLEDERKGVVKVTNLREVLVQNPDEALKQLRVGMQARKVEATAANARSSRSHAVFSMTLEEVGPAPRGPGDPVFQRRGAESRRVHARISLIDLAGSERATQTQNVGQALKDGAKINQSLLALANCIDALVYKNAPNNSAGERSQTPRRKPPYRDSKLTLLLKGSLTSDCLVSMIANVHPGRDHFEDSNNTLEYAKRASVVKAPVLVHRRARASSLPASRPPSPSPSDSPRSSASGSPAALSTSVPDVPAMVAAVARLDADAAAVRPKGLGNRTQSAANLVRTISAPTTTGRLLTKARTDSRLRLRRCLTDMSVEEIEPPKAAVASRSIGFRSPRAATPEVRSSQGINGFGYVDRARAKSAAPNSLQPLAQQQPQQQISASSSGSSTSAQACRRRKPQEESEPSGQTTTEREGRSQGHRRLSRCSESPIEASGSRISIEASSSFGTASPGGSSTAAPEDTARPRSPSPHSAVSRTTSVATAVSASSVTRSEAQRRDPSPLDLTAGRLSTSTSDASAAEVASPQPEAQASRPPSTAPSQARTASAGSAERAPLAPRDRGSSPGSASSSRPARHMASPLVARTRGQPGCLLLPTSPDATVCSQKEPLLLRLVDSLQAEKSALDERLRAVLADHARVEADNARLRTANLEKDRQLALLLGGHQHGNATAARESIGACSSLGFSLLEPGGTP